MKRSSLWMALLAILLPCVAVAQEMSSAFTYRLGLLPVSSDTLGPALEFDFRYELLRSSDDPRWHHFNGAVELQGWQSFSKNIAGVDHMELSAIVFGRYYRNEAKPLTPEQQDYFIELNERTVAAGGPGVTAAERAELNAMTAEVQNNHTFIGYDAYGRFETDRRVVNKRLNLGAGVQSEISFIGNALDAVFSKTRGADDTFVAQPLLAALAFEYVQGLGDREDSYPRGWAEVQWGTKAFVGGIYPRVSWQAEYATDGPEGIPDFNHFLDMGIHMRVPGTPAGIVAKFVYGRTGPNYEKIDGDFFLGIDVDSWR